MAPEIFDRNVRRNIAARAKASTANDRWLLVHLVEELMARLETNQTVGESALVLGSAAAELADLLKRRCAERIVVQGCGAKAQAFTTAIFDEDRPPFADASFDLVMSAGGLDTVSDLPGALLRIRQMLRPGGIFLGAMAAAGSLPALRGAIAPVARGAHFHPQIDVRAAGDLLARAGFDVPVADIDTLEGRFSNLKDLVRDIRANALSNSLLGRASFRRSDLNQIASIFEGQDQTARISEVFVFVHLSGRVRAL